MHRLRCSMESCAVNEIALKENRLPRMDALFQEKKARENGLRGNSKGPGNEMSLNLPQNAESTEQRAILDALPVPVFLEREGRIVFANAEARQRMGCVEGEQVDCVIDLPVEEVFRGVLPELDAGQEGPGASRSFHATLVARSGAVEPVEGTYRLTNRARREAVIVLDAGQRESAPMPQMLEEMLTSIPEALAIIRGEQALYINPAFTQLFGYTSEEVVGASMPELIMPENRRHESALLRHSVERQGHAMLESVRRNKAGEELDISLLVWPLVGSGERGIYVITYRDIGARKRAEDKLQFDALHDPLTGLPNRALFQDRLTLALSRRERQVGQNCGVLFLDLDRFKEINDTLGHAAGDLLLKEVSARLSRCVRPQDTAARLGGDEFAILAENIQSITDLQAVACRVSRELETPYTLLGQTIQVPSSIGAAITGSNHPSPEALLRDADFAMYRAKRAGGGRIEVFDEKLAFEAARGKQREEELRNAVENRAFELWLQPIYRLDSGKLEGFDSQLRWRRADGSADTFADLFHLSEDSGLSEALGQATAEAACSQLRAWAKALPQSDLTLAIPVTLRQFYNPGFVEQLLGALSTAGADPTRLLLEISEVTLNEKPEAARAILKKIASENLHVAVDHFGSSLAPINHLVRLPIDAVKLEPKMVAAAGSSKRQSAILESLIQLGRSLGVQVVAEGIQSEEQLTLMRRLGCDLGQGAYMSEAVDVAEALRLAEIGAWTIQPLA